MTLPDDFNWIQYLKFNPDLDQTSNEEVAKNHYINYGSYENRKYKIKEIPDDFFWLNYLKLNPDLDNFCDNEYLAEYHYINHGYYENRVYNNNKKNVYHISHNFGGGTSVYIENICSIFSNYNHIIINILDGANISVNNKLLNNKLLNQLIKNEHLLIVHHLLFFDKTYEKHKIPEEVFNFVKNIEMTKIFIVHDYFLFDENNPNPLKVTNNTYKEEKISEIKSFFSIFNKVFFNSINCYYNYIKYLSHINNAHLLNIVPDIFFYNKRIFPIKKEKYNIGIIGTINCNHKGLQLCTKIITFFETNNYNYNFVILGDYPLKHSNLVVTGKYENQNIFSMINNYDIDYFIFLSEFEETYSFTLSIALHTGLPIIYNNIGSYTERLTNYSNCFPFKSSSYEDILNILKSIEVNDELLRDKKNIESKYPNLYNNIPEFSNYLISDNNFNFNINEIEQKLNNCTVCFIHVCNIDVNGELKGTQIFNDQIDYIKKSGLYDKLDFIFVTLLGKNILLKHDYKIKLIYYSENVNEVEFPSIRNIKHFSDNISKKVKILYLHTKGVTNKEHSYEWRKYLEYFLIEKNDICLNALNNYNCVGVNHQYYYDVNKYRNHFSGNFWWSTSDYIKKLSLLQISEDRYACEHWLIGNLEINDYRNFLSLHHTYNDFYQNHLIPEQYNLEIIKKNIFEKLTNNFIKKRKIFGLYFICCIGNYLSIVNEQINKLIQSGLYDVTDEIFCFVCLERDECIQFLNNYDKIKIISTKENLYEKFAINNFKKYISDNEYYLYYMHSKSVTRNEQCYVDWRNLCDYFTIHKWRLSIEMLDYYDCIGTNLKNYPKKHYSGNFWWSKSEHISTLFDVNDCYLSSEMYICSNMKTNYVSIYQSFVNHGDTNYPEDIYNTLSDFELINNCWIIPDLNIGDKRCIEYCGNINPLFEPPIIELI
jgi:hypothetical protein